MMVSVSDPGGRGDGGARGGGLQCAPGGLRWEECCAVEEFQGVSDSKAGFVVHQFMLLNIEFKKTSLGGKLHSWSSFGGFELQDNFVGH